MPCNHRFLGTHLLLRIPVSNGLNSHLSEGRWMKLRVEYRLAERDQFQGLDELLTRDVLAQEAKGACRQCEHDIFRSVRRGKDDRSNRRICRNHPSHQVVCG